VKWQHKARIMQVCASLPGGAAIYEVIQKTFGRLDADPMTRIPTQIEMAHWLLGQGMEIEGKTFFEVGTGHKPIVPVGFFLSGAASVITVDLHRRLDWRLTREVLCWVVRHREQIETMYRTVVDSQIMSERLDVVQRLWSEPQAFLRRANIQYWAPADAADTGLSPSSIDYHFSVNTLEHIPKNIIRNIFIEASRILAPDGVAIHFVDTSDHFQHQDKSITTINFLRFPEKDWLHIAGNEFAYCNRLRASDYLGLFAGLSFEAIRTETEVDEEALTRLGNGFLIDQSFADYELHDLCATKLNIMLANRARAKQCNCD
jgi:SAM-dependent methyltransferase